MTALARVFYADVLIWEVVKNKDDVVNKGIQKMSANIRLTRRVCQATVVFVYTLVAATSLAADLVAPNLPQAVAVPIEQLVLVGDDLGLLKVCKVAGPGIAVGTVFEFTAGKATINVPAGVAPDGSCAVGPMLSVGTTVTLSENVPSGTIVASITVAPPQQAASAPDLTAGSAMVQIGKGVTEVTFTNKRTGYLEICKSGEVKGNFRFVINPGSLGPFAVGAGACSPPIEVVAGSVVITEWPSDHTSMVGCSTFPANQQLACDLEGQTSTIMVGPGDAANQTVAFIENGPTTVTETGTIKVVKVVKNKSRADLSRLTYPITVECDPEPAMTGINLADGQSGAVDGVPLSAECKVSEILPTAPEKGCPEGTMAQWSSSTSPDGYVFAGDTVTVTNVLDCVKKGADAGTDADTGTGTSSEYKSGTITVIKVVTNTSRADLTDWKYLITVECDSGPAETEMDLADGQSGVVDKVPFSAECKVTEAVPPMPDKACPEGTVAQWSSISSPDGDIYAGDTVIVTNALDCVKKGG